MKGDPEVIRLLNAVLTNELTSVNQYFLHARMFQHWGYLRLGKIVYDESIEEMRHADWLTQRILFLDGLPNLQELHKLSIGESVREAMTADLELEHRGRATLVEGVALCEARHDYVTRELLAKILSDTEDHLDYLETQVGLIQAIGEPNYLQSALGELQPGQGSAPA